MHCEQHKHYNINVLQKTWLKNKLTLFCHSRHAQQLRESLVSSTHKHTHAWIRRDTQLLKHSCVEWLQSITGAPSLQNEPCVVCSSCLGCFPDTQWQFKFGCYFCSQSKQRETCGVSHEPFAPPAGHFEELFHFGLQTCNPVSIFQYLSSYILWKFSF